MKKKLVALILSLVCAFTLLGGVAQAAVANDQPSDWAKDSVAAAKNLGLVTEEMQSGFQSAATRAEFCRLAVRFVEVYYGKTAEAILVERNLSPMSFNDTDDKAIAAAAALGITTGTGEGQFSPNQTLTREQAATMLRRVLAVIGKDIANPSVAAWTDAGKISDWARTAADAMYAAKVMNGTSTTTLVFSPQEAYTREQAVITVLNLWNYTHPVVVNPPVSGHIYDMSDPNVIKRPIYTTTNMSDLPANSPRWKSATEIIAQQKNDDPDYMINGMTTYEWHMMPIVSWVDNYVAINGLSYGDKTDFEKTEVIKHIVNSGRFEEFIGLWRPGFQFTGGDCAPRAEAVHYLMVALNFEMFRTVLCSAGGVAHVTNTYWDSSISAVRFMDAFFSSVWNVYVDELDEQGFILD